MYSDTDNSPIIFQPKKSTHDWGSSQAVLDNQKADGIHPLLVFARILDPSDEARFNVEQFTDVQSGKPKPKPDPLVFRHAGLTHDDLNSLIAELHCRNELGAGTFISVNRCQGHRCLESVVMVRAVHADLDNSSHEQREYLLNKLTPSIVVTSSEAHRLQLYWLLDEESSKNKEAVGRQNKILAKHYGADLAATDISRLLRAPGFKHMKYREEGRTPIVKAEYNQLIYSLSQIQDAFPEIKKSLGAPQKTKTTTADVYSDIEQIVIKRIKSKHNNLWAGNWTDAKKQGLFASGFNSQSEADMSLASHIVRELTKNGVPTDQLAESAEKIFSESSLADRDKWLTRDDYRERTISKAINNLKQYPVTATDNCLTTEYQLDTHKDVRNASRFASMFRGKLLFVSTTRKWLAWDGQRWATCEHGEELSAAKLTCKALIDEASDLMSRGDSRGTTLAKEAINAHTLARIEAMVSLSTSEQGMCVTANELDASPYLLGVRNGAVNLKTGMLLQADSAMLITKQCNADFIDDPTCPMWLKFLCDVFQGDEETIRSVQILLGYTLIGQVLDELMIICFGFGANGKSVFSNVISNVVGDYGQTATSSMLSVRRNDDHAPRNDLAGIKGARYLSVNELQAGDRLDERVVKAIAGREPISARFLFGEFFTFMPTFKAWVRTNHKPIILGDDIGIWRRIVLIPFSRTFNQEEQDPHLEEKLLSERDGILGWILQGTTEYLKTGIVISPRMRAEINSYRADSDLLGEFLDDQTYQSADAKAEQKDFYWNYKCWCERNGVRPQSKKSLTQRLKERGFLDGKSGSSRYYIGLKLIDLFDQKLEPKPNPEIGGS